MRGHPRTDGFSLIEALVAMAILAMVVLTFLGTRTDALIDAGEARNWRLAQEIASEVMSELRAGSRDIPPESGIETDLSDEHPSFSYLVLKGEETINRFETDQAGLQDMSTGGDAAQRLAWQRERDQLRMSRQKNISVQDYRDQTLQDEIDKEEDEAPTEDELEDVMVVVYFPDIRPGERNQGRSTFKLKAKVSTLALSCRTPEEAARLASAKGQTPTEGADGSTAPQTPGGTQR